MAARPPDLAHAAGTQRHSVEVSATTARLVRIAQLQPGEDGVAIPRPQTLEREQIALAILVIHRPLQRGVVGVGMPLVETRAPAR